MQHNPALGNGSRQGPWIKAGCETTKHSLRPGNGVNFSISGESVSIFVLYPSLTELRGSEEQGVVDVQQVGAFLSSFPSLPPFLFTYSCNKLPTNKS